MNSRIIALTTGLLLALAVCVTALDLPPIVQPKSDKPQLLAPAAVDQPIRRGDEINEADNKPCQRENPRVDEHRNTVWAAPISDGTRKPVDSRPENVTPRTAMPIFVEQTAVAADVSRGNWAAAEVVEQHANVERDPITRNSRDVTKSELVAFQTAWTSNSSLLLITCLAGVGGMMIVVILAYLLLRMLQLSAAVERITAFSRSDLGSRQIETRDDVSPKQQLKLHPTPCGLTSVSMPRVCVYSGVINQLVDGINLSRRKRGDVETGYALAGKISGKGPSRSMTICSLIAEGPRADRTSGHITFDRDYQQDELCLLQMVDSDLMHIGDAHLHPGNMDSCSSGDYHTDLGNVRNSRSQEMIFVIATRASAHWTKQANGSIYQDGLKLDFFYLGRATGYEYRRFLPEVVEADALEASGQLRCFIEADPIRARLDFDNLRRLTAYAMTVSSIPSGSGRNHSCIEMRHKARGFKTLITFSGDPRQPPEVFVDTGADMVRFQPPYLTDEKASVVWFTPIVLDVESELTNRQGAGTGNDTVTSVGRRSKPAEASVPGPRIGEHYGKLSTSQQGAGRGDPSGNGEFPVQQ